MRQKIVLQDEVSTLHSMREYDHGIPPTRSLTFPVSEFTAFAETNLPGTIPGEISEILPDVV
jgi:hypothetical protein